MGVAKAPFDAGVWRSDTPAAAAGRVHLNNAGAALMPGPVHAAIVDYLQREAQIGGYEASEVHADLIHGTYEALGSLLNTTARNIAVVENATVAFAQALSAFDFVAGDVILTTRNDYISNQLMYLSLVRRAGIEIMRADDLAEGGVDPDSVARLIRSRRPKLVALTWVPTNSGLVQPVHAIGEICEAAGVPCIIDACQAVGQIDIDVGRLRCDFLSGTARKFLRGPRGAGFLYVSDRMLAQKRHPLYIDMRGAEWVSADDYVLLDGARRFENWEFSYALHAGLGEAARYARRVGVTEAGAYAASLAADLRARLAAFPGVRVLDRGAQLCAIVTATFEGTDPATIMHRLREQAINIHTTHRDHAVIDMDSKQATSAVRISPHYYNTGRDIENAVVALEEFGSRK